MPDVLFVVNSLNCGGAEKSIVSLLNIFDFSRYNVDVLLLDKSGVFLKYVPSKVNLLEELPYFSFIKRTKKEQLFSFDLKNIFYMSRVSLGTKLERKQGGLSSVQAFWKYGSGALDKVKKEYDAAIAWGQKIPTYYVATKVRAKKKLAFINAEYNALNLDPKFDIDFYGKYDNIVAVSDSLCASFKKVFVNLSNKIKTIYDINNADMISQMASEYNPYKRLDGQTVLCTVARLVPEKGHSLLIKTAKVLKEKGVNFVWYVVGEGVQRKAIENAITENNLNDIVVLVGEKDNPYVYIINSDIYVQTSINEGFCITLAEARILNRPVVTTDFDAAYDQIKHGYNGLICEKSEHSLAKSIIRLIDDDELREKIIAHVTNEKKGNIDEIQKLYALLER